MKSLPYHLRSNKAVDRYMFIEVLKHVVSHHPKRATYQYIGMGGPFLEDLKVVEHYFPDMPLVSIEEEAEVVKRQEFHRFKRNVTLLHETDEEFVTKMKDDTLVALWFDYLGREPSDFQNFGNAVKKAANWSVLRITLNAKFSETPEFRRQFYEDFAQILPVDWESYFEDANKFALMLQKMVQTVTLPSPMAGYDFHIVNSSSYRDGAPMLTVTGIKCADADWKEIKNLFAKWPFLTRAWNNTPGHINVPELSLQERMHLGAVLPTTSKRPGHRLHRRLGYCIANCETSAANDLENYAAFARYFPVFARLAM